MANFQLDDLLKDDKKDANQMPDLSKATCNSQEEFRRLLECVPDYKLKPDKVRKEDARVRDKDFSFRMTKKEKRELEKPWAYGNPVPPEMRSLNLKELQQVNIDWRMLTPIRPKNRQDEEMFSRLVELGRLVNKTIAKEKRTVSNDIRKTKNRAGIVETSVKMCGDCGEEFCDGKFCGLVSYDDFARVEVPPTQPKVKISADAAAIIAGMDSSSKKKKKGKSGPKEKSRATSKKTVRFLVNKTKSSRNIKKKSKAKEKSEEKKENTKDDGEPTTTIKKFKRKCCKKTRKSKALPK